MNILVTGGCGFLGYYLVNELLKNIPEADIKIIDLKENPIESYKIKDKNVKIFLGKDITDFDSIKNEFKGVDTVIHCAGLVSFSLKDKNKLFKVNVEGTRNVLKAAVQNNVKDFIHISSVAALGFKDSKTDLVDEDFKFDWDIAKKNKKYYMLTKHLADEEALKYGNKMNIVFLYPGLMFGPGDAKNSGKLILAIKEGRIPFNMPGGTNVVDVRDVAKGIVLAIKNRKAGHYLLSGYNLLFLDMNKTIANVTKTNPPNKTIPRFLSPVLFTLIKHLELIKPNIELTADSIDSAFKFRYSDNSKAKNALKWGPEISFKKTIQDTYTWMRKDGIIKR